VIKAFVLVGYFDHLAGYAPYYKQLAGAIQRFSKMVILLASLLFFYLTGFDFLFKLYLCFPD